MLSDHRWDLLGEYCVDHGLVYIGDPRFFDTMDVKQFDQHCKTEFDQSKYPKEGFSIVKVNDRAVGVMLWDVGGDHQGDVFRQYECQEPERHQKLVVTNAQGRDPSQKDKMPATDRIETCIIETDWLWVGDPCYLYEQEEKKITSGLTWDEFLASGLANDKSFRFAAGHEGRGILTYLGTPPLSRELLRVSAIFDKGSYNVDYMTVEKLQSDKKEIEIKRNSCWICTKDPLNCDCKLEFLFSSKFVSAKAMVKGMIEEVQYHAKRKRQDRIFQEQQAKKAKTKE